MDTEEDVKENKNISFVRKKGDDSTTQNVSERDDKGSVKVELVSSSGEVFHLAKEHLIDCSDYFQGLFSSGMKESLLKRVKLPTVDSESLSMIVRYLEGKDLHSCLDLSNVKHLIAAANYLQMTDVLNICLRFVESSITVEECYGMMTFGEELMIPALVQLMEEYMKLNFKEFSQTEDFLGFTPENIIQLLSSDSLAVDKEIFVFDALVHWFYANSPLDKYDPQKLSEMTRCVRFGLLTEEERQLCTEHVKHLPDCVRQVVSNSSCFTDFPWRLHRDKSYWYMPRTANSKLCLMLTGGFTNKSERSTSRVQFMPLEGFECINHSRADSCYRFIMTNKLRLPEPLCEHSTCVIDNYLYVAGGQKNYCVNGKSTQNSVWKFDPRICQWIKVSSMNKPRSLFCLLPLDGSMYAVCGWLEPDRVNRSVERYDPETDSWHYVAPITIGLHEHAGCSYQGHLYVSGGYKGPARGHLDQLWRYERATDSWSQLCPMYQARSYHCMVGLDDENKLLVAGGVSSAGELFNDIQNCELYDVLTNQWTTISQIPLPASCMPCLLHKNKLYLFGGHAFQEGNDKHSSVQVLDITSWTWDVCTMNTSGIMYSCLNILHFPKHWLQKETNK